MKASMNGAARFFGHLDNDCSQRRLQGARRAENRNVNNPENNDVTKRLRGPLTVLAVGLAGADGAGSLSRDFSKQRCLT